MAPSFDIETKTPSGVESTPSGALPAGIVRETALLAGSTTESVFESMFGTHRSPPTNALASGFAPTRTVAVTLRVRGSSRYTRLRSLDTQSAPAPGVIQSAFAILIRAVIRFVRGLTRRTRPPPRSLTQSARYA